ncbi:MAG TPA: DNA-deoxyinosine glycosylase [Gammaproteobacteria bacterium]|nr:DNA-deoxyinosine glycosylase [Gammaproteobacteria bacterium]
MIVESFDCSANTRARVLILGSMPGVESLRRQQYYAHPRNVFWPIMDTLFGAGRELPYSRRLARLRRLRIALWDVAGRCFRPGSLDASIARESVVANNFAGLFAYCPRIHSVFFNGKTAAALYERMVLPDLPQRLQALHYQTLPSTSPANAALTREQKLEQWRVVKSALSSVPS